MKYAISCILTLLTKKNTYRYGDSIAKCRVSRILAHTPYPFAPTPRYLPAARVYLQFARPPRVVRPLQLLDALARNHSRMELRNTRSVMRVGRLINESFNCDFSHFVLWNVHGG